MILDITISYEEVFGFLFIIGLIPILVLISLWHLHVSSDPKKGERSRTTLRVISIILFLDSAFLTIQQSLHNEPGAVLAISSGVVIYSIILMVVAFRKEKSNQS